MKEIDYSSISPGIVGLVRAMREVHGYETCDSGDGSNYRKGMDCALKERHVFMFFGDRESARIACVELSNLYPGALLEITDQDDEPGDYVFFWPDGVSGFT